jgi:hypothetical protein
MGKTLTRKQLAALRGPQHWSAEDARAVLATCKTSGLSRARFCDLHRLSPQRLYTWARQIGDWETAEEASSAEPIGALVPLVVRSDPGAEMATTTAPLTVRLPSGVALEVRGGAVLDPNWLSALVAALRGSP